MKSSRNAKRYFVRSVVWVYLIVTISAFPAAFANSKQISLPSDQADDTLLVMLAPHSDRAKAATNLASEAGVTSLKDMHVDAEDYSILHVQAPKGQAQSSLQKIQAMMKSHPEIRSVGRNYMCYAARHHFTVPPNDPDFPQQWPLAAMRWTAAQAKYNLSQVKPASITILASGVTPVATNNELGAYVTQYNCLVTPPQREAVQGYDPEGDIDASITSCLTDNGILLAGAGCFQPTKPCHITMLRITNTSGKQVMSAILNALVFAINNQRLRGGPGPVNLSYGSEGNPDAPQGGTNVPLWVDPNIQALAGSLRKQGDILVESAGDLGTIGGGSGTWSSAFPAGNVVVVQGTDINNAVDTVFLTRLQGDPVAAPGDQQPAVISGQFNDGELGTSFSAPFWSSAIAMLISMNPHLTGAQAHQILLNTGTPATGAGYPVVIPAFDRAIQAVVGY